MKLLKGWVTLGVIVSAVVGLCIWSGPPVKRSPFLEIGRCYDARNLIRDPITKVFIVSLEEDKVMFLFWKPCANRNYRACKNYTIPKELFLLIFDTKVRCS